MNKELLAMPRQAADFADHARAQLDPGDPESIESVGRIAVSHLYHHARDAHAALAAWGLVALGERIVGVLNDVSALNIDSDVNATWLNRVVGQARSFWMRMTDRIPTTAGVVRDGLPDPAGVDAATQALRSALEPLRLELDESILALGAYAELLEKTEPMQEHADAADANSALRANELRLRLMQRAWTLRQDVAHARLLRERLMLCPEAAAVFVRSLEAVSAAAGRNQPPATVWQRLRGSPVTPRDMALETALEGLREQVEHLAPLWRDDGYWAEQAQEGVIT